ncbi:MAG TPA: helix-turn-helix domain-containing protein [Solirubrobacteraceae bacterium]|jgi:hypothetical protein
MQVVARGEVIRRIVERTDMDEFADRVLDTFWERPEFQRLRPPRESVRAWVRWNLELVNRWLIESRPPTEAELNVFREHARARASEGTPADVVPANFRAGARFAWRALLEAATDDERPALLESADLLFEYVDRVSRIYSEAYVEVASHASASAEEAAARNALSRISADEAPRPEDHRLAERLGFQLDRAARPFVVAAPRRSTEYHAELAATLRRRRALATSDRRRVIGLSNRRLDWDSLELDRRALIAHGAGAIGIERGHALDVLCDAVEVAVARGDTGHVEVDDYLGELLLRRSPRVAVRVEQRIYGPLGPELARTLDVLVEHNFERARSAAALPVHRNTLRDRIGRISELTGVDLESSGGRALAWLAWVTRTNDSG